MWKNSNRRARMNVRQAENIVSKLILDDGIYPNNGQLPVLMYPGAIIIEGPDPASLFEHLFKINQWGNSWRNGVFSYHHYHSQAHEVLGIYGGSAKVQLGGEQGPVFSLKAGDVVIIPAGVAHKKLVSDSDFSVVGAYPAGQSPDTCYGEAGERPVADKKIERTALPKADPVYGMKGLLIDRWE
jgi:uncharacterized protein YjlB